MKQNEQIKKVLPITTLFVDISGVFLTNGWDHHARNVLRRPLIWIWMRWKISITWPSILMRWASSSLRNTWAEWCLPLFY